MKTKNVESGIAKKIEIICLKIIFTSIYISISIFFRVNNNQIYLMSSRAKTPSIGLKIIGEKLQENKQIKTKHFYFDRLEGRMSYFFKNVLSLHNLATSRVVIIDDHFFAINALYLKRKQNTVIQIWHAAGTIKQFGNRATSNSLIPHKNYDYVCVNKEADREKYAVSLGVDISKTVVTGALQLFYLDKKRLERNYSVKKQLFYAPTYRSGNNDYSKILVKNFIQAFEQENSDMELKISLHPYVDISGIPQKYLVDKDNFYNTIFESSFFVTDYSSLIIDFSLLHRPIYFYIPDYEAYKKNIGFFSNDFLNEHRFPLITDVSKDLKAIEYSNYDFYHVEKLKNEEFTQDSRNALMNVYSLIIRTLNIEGDI